MSKVIRWSRLVAPSGAMLMLPLDHGISNGPIEGLRQPGRLLAMLLGPGGLDAGQRPTCVAVHKGLVPVVAPFAKQVGILLHLSASTQAAPDPNDKRIVATVAEAVRLGCDGVSVHVNVGSATEARQLEEVGRISADCQDLGMPLVAMMYPRGPNVKDPNDPNLVAHAARLGFELGADAVKVPFTGSAASFERVVAACPIPVIVAGGLKREDETTFHKDLHSARQAGAAGVSVGRNVFQAKDPVAAMAAIARLFA